MPKKLERKLRLQGRKKGYTGERLDRYVYGSLTNMGWRKGDGESMGSKRRKLLGAGLVLLLLAGLADAAVTPPTTFQSPPAPRYAGTDVTRGLIGTLEVVDVPTDATTPPNYGTCLTWIPWKAGGVHAGADTVGYRAVYVYMKMESGDGVKVRAFGPSLGTSLAADRDITLDTDESEALPFEVDSLWIWDETSTSTLRIIAF